MYIYLQEGPQIIQPTLQRNKQIILTYINQYLCGKRSSCKFLCSYLQITRFVLQFYLISWNAKPRTWWSPSKIWASKLNLDKHFPSNRLQDSSAASLKFDILFTFETHFKCWVYTGNPPLNKLTFKLGGRCLNSMKIRAFLHSPSELSS